MTTLSNTKRCRSISRQPDPERRYLRIAQAADYLNSTTWFVYTLTWNKAIPYTKLGKRLIFDRVDLDNYMQNLKVGAA
jgi:excisionase family DNA binding protein